MPPGIVDVAVDIVRAVSGRIPCNGSLGASFVPADWRVRVFESSGLKDRPSDRLSIRTIPLSGCMDRRSRYTLKMFHV